MASCRHKEDTIWSYSGGVLGMANTFSACTSDSYGIVRLSNNTEFMVNIIGHEIAHILGVAHDGKLSWRR